MSTSVIIDLAILLVLAVSIIIGLSKGMVRGLLTLSGTILALVIASEAAGIAADTIVDRVIRPATHTAIEEYIREMPLEDLLRSPLEEVRQSLDAIQNEFIREEAKKLLDSFGLSTDASDAVARDTLITMSSEIVDTVLYGAVRQIISALACVLIFAILSFVLRPIVWLADQAFHLPLLRQVNQIGGLLLGIIRGTILVFVAVWALRLLGLWVTEEVVAQSVLLKLVADCLDAWHLSPVSAGIL